MRSRRRLAFIALFTTLIIVGVPLSVTMGELLARAYLPLARPNWPLPSPTPGPGRLWVSEVVYDPLGTETEGEWIEVYNPGGYALALAGYKLGDEESREGNEAMLQFPGEAVIEAGGVLGLRTEPVLSSSFMGGCPTTRSSSQNRGCPTWFNIPPGPAARSPWSKAQRKPCTILGSGLARRSGF